MCLIINKQNIAAIPKKYLERAFRRNPHGAGFCYLEDGTVKIQKGYFTFADFWTAFEPRQYHFPMLIHFRFSTGGSKNKANCHPFKFGKKFAMVHNGNFHIKPKAGRSDTAQFVSGMLNPMVWAYGFDSPVFKQLIENFAGKDNKLVLMDNTGKTIIINEQLGKWDNGNWYSNTDYRKIPSFGRTWRKRWFYIDSGKTWWTKQLYGYITYTASLPK